MLFRSRSKKKWKCSEIDAKTGKPCAKVYKDKICPHLEALLPKTPKGNGHGVKLVYLEDLSRFPVGASLVDETAIEDFEEKLKKLPLSEEDREIMIARFFYMMPFGQIAEEMGYTTTGAAYYHYRKVIQKLRELGTKAKELI